MASQYLDALPVGGRAVVSRLGPDSPVMRRLAEMGLTPGAEVELMRRAPLGDPIQLRLRGCQLTLRRRDARQIEVRT